MRQQMTDIVVNVEFIDVATKSSGLSHSQSFGNSPTQVAYIVHNGDQTSTPPNVCINFVQRLKKK
jgi:hypothetical protein